METIVGNDYKLVKKLGSGAFGEVFMARHTKNETEVAIKMEAVGNRSPQLFVEAKIISIISGDDPTTDYGVPRCYYCASEG